MGLQTQANKGENSLIVWFSSAYAGEILGLVSVTQRARPQREAILFP